MIRTRHWSPAVAAAAAACAVACSTSSGAPPTGGTNLPDAAGGGDAADDGSAGGDGSAGDASMGGGDGSTGGGDGATGDKDSSIGDGAIGGGDGSIGGGDGSIDGASGGGDGSAGGGDSGAGGNGDAGAPLCDPAHAWTTDDSIDPAIPSAGFEQFGAVSRDELTVAWTTTSGTIEVADRASRNDDFGAPTAVSTGATAIANDRVALSWTGLEVLALSADRTEIVPFARPSQGGAWAAGTESAFVNVNALAGNGGGAFSELVLGDDGKTLYFLFALPSQVPAMFESDYDGVSLTWSIPRQFTNSALTSTDATHRRRPTGGSSDARTLFFYDEIAGIERGAWRSAAGGAFDQFVDLGALPEAAPNDLCDALYFQADQPDAGGEGIGEAF